jgi:hypothetical protein
MPANLLGPQKQQIALSVSTENQATVYPSTAIYPAERVSNQRGHILQSSFWYKLRMGGGLAEHQGFSNNVLHDLFVNESGCMSSGCTFHQMPSETARGRISSIKGL